MTNGFGGRRITAKQALLIIGDYESSASVPDDERATRIVGGILGYVPGINKDSKSVEESLERLALKYLDYLPFCDAVDDLEEMLCIHASTLSSPYPVTVSPTTHGTLRSLGLQDRAIKMVLTQIREVLRPRTPADDDCCQHSISDSTLKRLPWLLERPVLLANSPDDPFKLLAVLRATDERDYPLITSMRLVSEDKIDVQGFIENAILAVFGPAHFYDYFGTALDAEKVIYIDSQEERKLAELLGRRPFSGLGALPRDEHLASPNGI